MKIIIPGFTVNPIHNPEYEFYDFPGILIQSQNKKSRNHI